MKYFDWKKWAVRHLGFILNLINCRFDDVGSEVSRTKLTLKVWSSSQIRVSDLYKSLAVKIKTCITTQVTKHTYPQSSKMTDGSFLSVRIFQELISLIWNICNKILEIILNVLLKETIIFLLPLSFNGITPQTDKQVFLDRFSLPCKQSLFCSKS